MLPIKGFWTIKKQLLATFTIFVLITIAISGIWVARLMHEQTRTHTINQFMLLADTMADQAGWLIEKEIQSAETLIRSHAVQNLTIGHERIESNFKGVAETMRLIYSDQPVITIYSPNGGELFSSPKDVTSLISPSDMHATSAFLRQDKESLEYYLIFSLPIPDSDGQPSGNVAVFAISMNIFDRQISSLRLGESGHANLMDSTGVLIACPIFAPMSHEVPSYTAGRIFSEPNGWMVAENDGHGLASSIAGFSRVKFVKKSSVTDSLSWAVFVRQTEEEIFAPLKMLYWKLALFCLALLVIFLFVNYRALLKSFKPLSEIEASTMKIRDGLFSHRLGINSTDEFGTLAKAFDEMAKKLESREYNLKEHERLDGAKECIMELSDQIRNPLASLLFASRLLSEKFDDLSVQERLALFHVLKNDAATLGKYFDDFLYVVDLPSSKRTAQGFESFMNDQFSFWTNKLYGATPKYVLNPVSRDWTFTVDPNQLVHAVKHFVLYLRASNREITEMGARISADNSTLVWSMELHSIETDKKSAPGNECALHLAIVQRILTNNDGEIKMVSTDKTTSQYEWLFPSSVESGVAK